MLLRQDQLWYRQWFWPALIFLVISTVDYVVTAPVGLSLFYIIPILQVTRLFGRNAGLTVSLGAAVAWLFSDLGTEISSRYALVPYWNALIRLSFFTIITTLFSAWEAERINARTDTLTGLHNRKALDEFLQFEIARCQRFKRPLSLISFDVDDFKQINDRYGHAGGDRVLVAIARSLIAGTRETDRVVRLGGDEFIVLLPETSAKLAFSVMSRIKQSLFRMSLLDCVPTLSAGIVTITHPALRADKLLQEVDKLLYKAKRKGKNRAEQKTLDEKTAHEESR
ncbi:MAG: GGDEF domain-containing protein [Candidatus Omnitrophica bacterium]|nr:GGDEF domain-containing protein [Candidatus Omnitrophota bacterium]